MKIKIKRNTKLQHAILLPISMGVLGLTFSPLSLAQANAGDSNNLPEVQAASSSWSPDSASTNQAADQPNQTNQANQTPASVASAPVRHNQSMGINQKIAIMQQSLDNINKMDFPAQVQTLQNQIQKMQGDIDVLQHQLKVLTAKQAKADLATKTTQNSAGNAMSDSTQVATADASESESQATTTTVTPQAINPNLTPAEQAKQTYKAAFSLVQARAYQDAIEAFKGYLKIYGDDSAYSPNAYYWLGELYSHEHDYNAAKTNLLQIVNHYPNSNKAADAMLKLGIIAQKEGDQAKADQWLTKVIKQYPKSTSAKLAKSYLH